MVQAIKRDEAFIEPEGIHVETHQPERRSRKPPLLLVHGALAGAEGVPVLVGHGGCHCGRIRLDRQPAKDCECRRSNDQNKCGELHFVFAGNRYVKASASDIAAKAPADGYTLLVVTVANATNATL